ncbi:T9SS type A sorting domain-containing protein, partial [Bacteroides cellulosilyticus]
SNLYIFETIGILNASNSTIQIPTTPGEPDFCFADEENGVVSIKKGEEQLMLNFYFREEADNRLVRGHHITTDYQRFFEVKTDKTEARYVASYRTRDGWVNGPSTSYGTPPDNPTSAYEGQVEYYNSYDGVNYNTGRLLKDYYFLRYGKFLIAMNTLSDASKTIEFPNELVGASAWQFHTETSITLPATMQLPPCSTYVFILDDNTTQAGLITDNLADISTNKDLLKAAVSEKEAFAQLPETALNISLVGMGGKYKPDLFLRFMRELSYAKTIANNSKVTQEIVDIALADLNNAYSALINETFTYDPCPIPGMVNFDKKMATGGTITIGSASGDIGSTRQGAYVVVPLLATVSGNYIVTIKAATTRGSDVSPRINLALIDESTDFVNYKVDEKDSKLIKQESSWSNYSEYKWSFDLNANDLKFMRLTFLVNDAGWAVNVGDIVFKLSSSWERLQELISNAQEILDTFSNPTNPEYASISDEDRNMLKSAIENAKTISSDASDDDCNNGMNTLQNAIDRFYEAITTMNMIPGAINLSSYEETFGSIKVGDIIDATKNNSGIIYKVRPRTDGIYIPSISASTNTEAADNPRVNISVSSDLEILKEQTVDPDNSVLVEKGANGWNTFKTYKFPETAPLSANQDYYILLRFLTDVNWCVNLNSLSMILKDTGTSIEEPEMGKPVIFYPNPAANYIIAGCSGKIMISDLKGITHINRLVSAGERIDLRILTSGFYIVHMISNDKLYVAKMIKK